MESDQRRFERAFQTLGFNDEGHFYRFIPLRFQESPLSAVGSLHTGGRYNPAGEFEVFYIGDNPDTVLRETRMIVTDLSGNVTAVPGTPRVLMTITWQFKRIVDLTEAAVRKRLRVRLRDLLAEWEDAVDAGIVPLTHTIGVAARNAGIEALIVPSARHKRHRNMAVFYDCLLRGSFVAIHDPSGFVPGTRTRVDGAI